jgi:hypothetical protein
MVFLKNISFVRTLLSYRSSFITASFLKNGTLGKCMENSKGEGKLEPKMLRNLWVRQLMLML